MKSQKNIWKISRIINLRNNPLYYIDPDGRFAAAAVPFIIEFFTVAWGSATAATAATVSVVTTDAVVTAVVITAGTVAIHQGLEYLDGSLNKEEEDRESRDKNEKYRDPNFPGTDSDLEKNPDWAEVSHADQRKAGHREFLNGKTGKG